MKKGIYKCMAFFMTVVVLMTTTSFTVDLHYCGNTLIDFSFIQQVKTCGMEKMKSTRDCITPLFSKKSCCTDQQLVKEGQDNFKISLDKLSLQQQVFVASLIYSYLNLFEGTQSKEVPFTTYSPPDITPDVRVLHQTFLI